MSKKVEHTINLAIPIKVWDEVEETYIYQQQFDIPMIRVEGPDE